MIFSKVAYAQLGSGVDQVRITLRVLKAENDSQEVC